MTRTEARTLYTERAKALAAIESERAALVAHTDTRYKAARQALDEPLEVLGEPHGHCEGCGVPIFEGDQFGPCDPGVMLCADHTFNLSDCLAQHRQMLASKQWFWIDKSEAEMREDIDAIAADIAENGDRKVLYTA